MYRNAAHRTLNTHNVTWADLALSLKLAAGVCAAVTFVGSSALGSTFDLDTGMALALVAGVVAGAVCFGLVYRFTLTRVVIDPAAAQLRVVTLGGGKAERCASLASPAYVAVTKEWSLELGRERWVHALWLYDARGRCLFPVAFAGPSSGIDAFASRLNAALAAYAHERHL